MKILVVDDSNDKIAKVMGALVDLAGISREQISVAHTIQDAKRELRENYFDLLVLDVLVPTRAGEEPEAAGAIALLEELAVRKTLQKPGYILGLTAYERAIEEAGAEFVKRTWTVLAFSTSSEDWKARLIACVDYIRSSREQPAERTYSVDLCVITALATPEYAALTKLPWHWGSAEPLDDSTFVQRGRITAGGGEMSVVAACASKVGMVSAALLAAKLIERERPRFLAMVGICAGVRGKANFGDVILADPCWDWQSGKHFLQDDASSFAIAPDPIPVPSFVRARYEQLKADTRLWAEVRHEWPAPPDTELKLRLGPVATGSAVLADRSILEGVVAQNRNLLGVEMEAFGVAAAASAASHPRPTALILKSVCDFADEAKDDAWQTYAAYTSAQALRHFAERYLADVRDLAGTK